MRKKILDPKRVANFMIKAGRLKWLRRSGWIREKVPEPESVAEHTFRIALLARIVAQSLNLDTAKLTAMAIFHDLAEGMLGDPVTERGKKQVGEHDWNKEKKVMKKTFSDLGMAELYPLWEENILENGIHATEYSKILYEIGKIATVWQALEYEMIDITDRKLNEFWENADYHVKNKFLRQILNELMKMRK